MRCGIGSVLFRAASLLWSLVGRRSRLTSRRWTGQRVEGSRLDSNAKQATQRPDQILCFAFMVRKLKVKLRITTSGQIPPFQPSIVSRAPYFLVLRNDKPPASPRPQQHLAAKKSGRNPLDSGLAFCCRSASLDPSPSPPPPRFYLR